MAYSPKVKDGLSFHIRSRDCYHTVSSIIAAHTLLTIQRRHDVGAKACSEGGISDLTELSYEYLYSKEFQREMAVPVQNMPTLASLSGMTEPLLFFNYTRVDMCNIVFSGECPL